MPEHKESVILAYSKEELSDLILDVEKYPEFLPWCSKCTIINKKSPTHFFAELAINYKQYRKSYISEINTTKSNNAIVIKVKMVRGPFKHLVNSWNLTDYGKKTKLEFYINLELKSFALQLILSGLFNYAYKKMLNSFINRAELLYNTNSHL